MGISDQDWEVKSLDDLNPGDLQLVSDFFNEQFPGVFYPECTPEIFKWKLGPSNPAGQGFLSVAMSNGLVVGAASGTKKIIVEDEKLISAIEIGDTFTHPDFRKKGKCITPPSDSAVEGEYFEISVFGRLVSETIMRARAEGVTYIYGTPNGNSKPPYLKRLKFSEIDKGKIISNVILTSKMKSLRKVRWVLASLEFFSQLSSHILRYSIFHKNSIQEITKEEFLMFSLQECNLIQYEPGKVFLVNNTEVLKHRYVNHPSHQYRYFQIEIGGVKKGVLITCEVIRSSGLRSFVVSDWLISDKRIEKRLSLFISKLRSYSKQSETISFWEHGGSTRLTNLLLGVFKRRNISVISKDFRETSDFKLSEFGDFRIGWSDNG